MKRYILAVVLVCMPGAAYALTQAFTITVAINSLNSVFNCTGFATSGNATTGNCGVRFPGSSFGTTMQALGATSNNSVPFISGTTAVLVPAGANHNADNLNYELAAVNVGQFSSTFTFVPDGQNVSFVLSNNTNTSVAGNATNGNFTAGASCEGAFFQAFDGTGPVNKTFAVMLESYGGNAAGSGTFTYSSVQWYEDATQNAGVPPNAPNAPGMSPCNPDDGGVEVNFTYVGVNKLSTSPVALNSPAGTLNTTTGDTYSATVTYDGSNLNICLVDVTLANGTCTSGTTGTGTFFTTSWTGVNVPAIVGGTTAWVGLAGATGTVVNPAPLIIKSFSYSSN